LYPELVGKLLPPDNRLVLAPLPPLPRLFGVLAQLAAVDPHQLRTHYALRDR
jgi:hypothetical protein